MESRNGCGGDKCGGDDEDIGQNGTRNKDADK